MTESCDSVPTAGPTPPYRLEFEVRPKFLLARVYGDADTAAISLGYWREVAIECRKQGRRRVLVVESFKGKATPMEMFEVASHLGEVGLRGITIAFVDTELDQLPENLFGETVAKNRGIHGKLFNSIAAAELWLDARPSLPREL